MTQTQVTGLKAYYNMIQGYLCGETHHFINRDQWLNQWLNQAIDDLIDHLAVEFIVQPPSDIHVMAIRIQRVL